jgi:diaminopimelate decarboxylase
MEQYWWLYKGFEIHKNEEGQSKVFFKNYPVDLESIAHDNPTPVYVLNGDRIEEKVAIVRRAFAANYKGEVAIHFAMKASHIPQVVQLLARVGCGVDVASPNETNLGLRLGIPAEKIMFTGTSVSDTEIKDLVDMKVRINIDSFSQLRRLIELAKRGELSCSPLPLSVRLNPDVGAITSQNFTTAGARNAEGVPIKFGIEPKKIVEVLEYAHANGLVVDTLHFHIGSGWLRPGMEAFRQALQNGLQVYRRLLEAGFPLTRLDVGGGAGIRNRKEGECFPWDEYATVIATSLEEANIKLELLILEPGDGLVSDAGVFLTSVNTVEVKYGVEHVFVDSGMGSFPQIRLNRDWKEFVNVSRPDGLIKEYAVDGDVCETGDTFTYNKLRPLPEVREGDVLAFLDAGGYNPAQSFNYCLRGRAHIMLRKGDQLVACTRGVESLDEIMSRFIPNYSES